MMNFNDIFQEIEKVSTLSRQLSWSHFKELIYIDDKLKRDFYIELCKIDKSTQYVFGKVNAWWVFGEVVKELNYKIFMAEVENVGYKRTKVGYNPMPNELCRVNNNGDILVDDGVKETALDYLRDVLWD